jgi:hypothetical protein
MYRTIIPIDALEWKSQDQLAAILGVTTRTIRNRVATGEIIRRKLPNSRVVFRIAEAETTGNNRKGNTGNLSTPAPVAEVEAIGNGGKEISGNNRNLDSESFHPRTSPEESVVRRQPHSETVSTSSGKENARNVTVDLDEWTDLHATNRELYTLVEVAIAQRDQALEQVAAADSRNDDLIGRMNTLDRLYVQERSRRRWLVDEITDLLDSRWVSTSKRRALRHLLRKL